MENMKNKMPKMPPGAASAAAAGAPLLARVALLGAAAVYGVSNSIFNVEGGHRAIVFNRVVGIKEEVGIGLGLELERALTLTRATRFARSPGVRGGDAFYAAVVRAAYYF
jgi:hypothetical protein